MGLRPVASASAWSASMTGARHLFAAVLRHIRGELVIEHIGQAFEEDQGQDEVLELRRIGRAPDFARGVPQPLLQGGDVEMFLGVGAQGERRLCAGLGRTMSVGGLCRLWHSALLSASTWMVDHSGIPPCCEYNKTPGPVQLGRGFMAERGMGFKAGHRRRLGWRRPYPLGDRQLSRRSPVIRSK